MVPPNLDEYAIGPDGFTSTPPFISVPSFTESDSLHRDVSGGNVHPGSTEDEFVAELSETMLAIARSSDRYLAVPYPPKDEREEDLSTSALREESVQAYAELRPSLLDVESSVERYADQDRFLRGFGFPVPVVVIGDDYVPVDLGVDNWGYLPSEAVVAVINELVETATSPPTALVEPQRAETGFRNGLQRFLKMRLYPGKGRTPPGSTTPVGYDFEVITKTRGLQINYSPAYFINRRLVFGAPTTPVRGRLHPGRYIFGAYPPSNGYWTTDEYDVPGPTTTAYLNI